MRATLLTHAPSWAVLASLLVTANPARAEGKWVDVTTHRGVRVQARDRDDGIRELRATGVIDAPTDDVFGLICNIRSTLTLVPHLKQFRILDEREHVAIAYQRLEVPTMAPRDFTIRAACRVEEGEGGSPRRVNEWRTENALGPPRVDGVVRLELNEGSWVLEEIDGGQRTRATYRLKIDPGGEVPRFIVNTAMQMQVPQLFADVAREATTLALPMGPRSP